MFGKGKSVSLFLHISLLIFFANKNVLALTVENIKQSIKEKNNLSENNIATNNNSFDNQTLKKGNQKNTSLPIITISSKNDKNKKDLNLENKTKKDKRFIGFGGKDRGLFWFDIGGGLSINNAINGNLNLRNRITSDDGFLLANQDISGNVHSSSLSSPLFIGFGFIQNYYSHFEYYFYTNINLVALSSAGFSYNILGSVTSLIGSDSFASEGAINGSALGTGWLLETGPNIPIGSFELFDWLIFRPSFFVHLYSRLFIGNINGAVSRNLQLFAAGNPNVILGGLVGFDNNLIYKDFVFNIRGGVLVSPNIVVLATRLLEGNPINIGGVIGTSVTYLIPDSSIGIRLGIEYEHLINSFRYNFVFSEVIDGHRFSVNTPMDINIGWQYLWFKFGILF